MLRRKDFSIVFYVILILFFSLFINWSVPLNLRKFLFPKEVYWILTVLPCYWLGDRAIYCTKIYEIPEVDSLDGTVGRRPQVKLRSRARHWSGCTLRPIECEHRALDLRLTWGFLPQSPIKKPVSGFVLTKPSWDWDWVNYSRPGSF